ncbi:MAG: JAB domain-containing protein [Roseivirga sp.]
MSELNRMVADIKISYHPKIKIRDCAKVKNGTDAATLFRENWDDTQIGFVEEMKVMLLNRGGRVLGIAAVSKGGMGGTYCDPKVIFCTALKAGASQIILAHNHPSGEIKPSQPDLRLTRKLCDGARLLELCVLDHIILTEDRHLAFSEEGLMPG